MSKPRVAVLVSGSGSNLQALLDAERAHAVQYKISLIVSNRPGAYALERAQLQGVKSLVINHQDFASRQEFDDALMAVLIEHGIDIIVLAGFMRRLTPSFVQCFAGRLLNIHPSLLPMYPGLRTHERALADHAERHGCSIHFVSEVLDGGPVIAQLALDVLPGDDAVSLGQRVLELEHRLYWRVLDLVARGRVCLRDGLAYYDDRALPATGIAHVSG